MSKKSTIAAFALAMSTIAGAPSAQPADTTATQQSGSGSNQMAPSSNANAASKTPGDAGKQQPANPCGPSNPCGPKKRGSAD